MFAWYINIHTGWWLRAFSIYTEVYAGRSDVHSLRSGLESQLTTLRSELSTLRCSACKEAAWHVDVSKKPGVPRKWMAYFMEGPTVAGWLPPCRGQGPFSAQARQKSTEYCVHVASKGESTSSDWVQHCISTGVKSLTGNSLSSQKSCRKHGANSQQSRSFRLLVWCHSGYSSVGRASDCRLCRNQMVPGSIPGGRIVLPPPPASRSSDQSLRGLQDAGRCC